MRPARYGIGAAEVGVDDRELGELVETARKNEREGGRSGVEDVADDVFEAEALQRASKDRSRGVEEHRQRARLQEAQIGREARAVERLSGDVRGHMNSAKPGCYGLVKNLDGCISVAKRQRGKPPEPVRVCPLCASELVVQKPVSAISSSWLTPSSAKPAGLETTASMPASANVAS